MLHLLKNAVDPGLTLKQCVANWYEISCSLREPTRKRALQVEKFDDDDHFLS